MAARRIETTKHCTGCLSVCVLEERHAAIGEQVDGGSRKNQAPLPATRRQPVREAVLKAGEPVMELGCAVAQLGRETL